jgi:hypothetical protein
MTNVRKLRWTWAADWQAGDFERSEFFVTIDNWQVSGNGLFYQIAGPGSRRIEDDSDVWSYSGSWTTERGNYSGGSIAHTTKRGAALACKYLAATDHQLLIGTRYTDNGGKMSVQVDSATPLLVDLRRPLEDVLIRVPVGNFGGSIEHAIVIRHDGADGTDFYFDFLEIASPSESLPEFDISPTTTLATDWDTNHSLAIAPERTAWEISTLGFHGRANHYAGAMWFYELACIGNVYASVTVTFAGAPPFGATTELIIGDTTLQHANLIGDSAERIAKAFEFLLTAGSSAVRAEANGATLTIRSCTMGTAGNALAIGVKTNSPQFSAAVSNSTLTGGVDGRWTTDLTATPRLNRAARDWSRSYFGALHKYGIDAAASFSMELRHGDDSLAAGIAQRYPDGPVWLSTPALQTNFGPGSRAFWQQVYTDMAQIMTEAGLPPYLQFGEVQWWYFADGSGMPFYDTYTRGEFESTYSRPLPLIPNQSADPAIYPEECQFLSKLIGEFTDAVMAFVRQSYPKARFEVLYPPDTNDTPLNGIVNYPTGYWTPATMECLKTENFTYTGNRNLDQAWESISLPASCGFGPGQRSHLVGISDPTTPWRKEQDLALGAGTESLVLFALDQFCLIGYPLPQPGGQGRSAFMGA